MLDHDSSWAILFLFLLRWQCALHTVVLSVMQDRRGQMLQVKLVFFRCLFVFAVFFLQVSEVFSDEFSWLIYLLLSQSAPTGFAAPRLTAGSTFIVVQWGKLEFLVFSVVIKVWNSRETTSEAFEKGLWISLRNVFFHFFRATISSKRNHVWLSDF